MNSLDHMVEQQILERESRLKYIDELLDHAHDQANAKRISKEEQDELKEIRQVRHKLAEDLDTFRVISKRRWETDTIESAGPLGIWDVVAQRIEKFIERISKS